MSAAADRTGNEPVRGLPGCTSDVERIAAHIALVDRELTGELDALARLWDDDSPETPAPYAVNPPAELRSLLGRGGKRTRPVMTYLGWLAADVDGTRRGHEDMVRASVAIEMLHCFALIHDDVMDESPTRRGRPTVHDTAARLHARHRGRGASERFGDTVAVLVGDLAHSEADRLAATLPAPMRHTWRQMVLELISGQLRDVVGSAAADRRVDYARAVARGKTGDYTVAKPLRLGALAAGADDAALSALAGYGRHAGEAFALRDDVLGVYGDPQATGKPAGDDIRSGKPTVLLALAQRVLRGRPARVLQLAGSPDMTDAQVRMLQDAMVAQGVVATVESMIDDLVDAALAALDTDSLSVDGVGELTCAITDLARRGR
jgi:geranylgeranyl diphosphate synthase, type I